MASFALYTIGLRQSGDPANIIVERMDPPAIIEAGLSHPAVSSIAQGTKRSCPESSSIDLLNVGKYSRTDLLHSTLDEQLWQIERLAADQLVAVSIPGLTSTSKASLPGMLTNSIS